MAEELPQETPPPDPESAPPPTSRADAAINFAALNAALGARIKPAAAQAATELDELADDLLQLLRRVQAVERRQEEALARLDQLGRAVQDGFQRMAAQQEALARESVGDRKALAVLGVINAALPALESLAAIRSALRPDADSAVARQVTAATDLLTRLVRQLGVTEFSPEPGKPFDPWSMECGGHADGPPGVVLGVIRPGYRAGDQVVLPAAVALARPAG